MRSKVRAQEKARRRDQIVDLLSRYGELSAGQLADFLNVTVQTVRTDLRELDELQLIKRRHGNASLSTPAENIGYLPRTSLAQDDKCRIAAKVADLVPEGASLAIGTGTTAEERDVRIDHMIEICKANDYGHVFAGYGFMAEDAHFVGRLEKAGINFLGPCSYTVESAGLKDEAKRTALENDVSVTPGINDATARTVVSVAGGDLAGLRKLAEEKGLDAGIIADGDSPLEAADKLLDASFAAKVDLFTLDQLGAEVQKAAAEMLAEYEGNRIRIKAIGGGGGKGQRILSDAALAPELVREALGEVKALGVGDNKNVLIELNIEQTRHNEIQLIGNGEWCVALGGRDCSLQMHEQKLLEVSITQEALAEEIAAAKAAGQDAAVKSLETDLETLKRMEAEAERFGEAVKLDSASTFECIVSGPRHFFMEVNTRIQVEHRVSELCYALRFTNPEDANDYFDVHSLVECMALLGRHKADLPKPTRVRREAAAVEARLNATNRALQPHAGGEIISWSDPIEGEIRDDQGISTKNPDTGLFMRYKLAGAYDSNVALLLTVGGDRRASYEAMAEVLRRTTLRGPDLATNLEFHYGLVHFYLSQGVMAQPTTRFVVPYLTLVGQLKEEANQIDLTYAYRSLTDAKVKAAGGAKEAVEAASLQHTLVLRPLQQLWDEPHFLSAWLSAHRNDYTVEGGKVSWKKNPVQILADTYHLLHMEAGGHSAAAHAIWEADAEQLDEALGFYRRLAEKAGGADYPALAAALESASPSFGIDADLWAECRAAHQGFQFGLGVLDLLPLLGDKVGFYDLKVEEDLKVTIPERLTDADLQARMAKFLVPPPVRKDEKIVAPTGGMFYGQESPGMPRFVEKGKHFAKGDPLFILEVMKMFNKVYAPFAGTIDEIVMDGGDGTIVSKGQVLFKVTPDEKVVVEDPAVLAARVRENTDACLAKLG